MKYPSYKDSGLKWIGEIPEHWKKTKVGNLYEITLGKMLQPKPRTSNDLLVPYLKAMNIQDGYIHTSNVDEMYSNNTEIEQMSIDKGDLLVCEGGEVARSAIVNSNYEGYIFQNSLHRVRSTNKGMNLYLHYLLNAVRGSGYINILVNKATIAHFTKDKFSSLKICVPPLVEQKAISKYLEIKTAEIDLLISDKEKLIELLAEKRQAIINEEVTKGLNPDVKMKDSGVEWIGEIPEHWDIVKLKYCLKDGSLGVKIGPFGSSLKLDTMVNEGYKVYGQENLIKRDFDIGKRYITKEKFEELSVYEINTGDVLISMMGTIGKCMVVPSNIKKGVMDSHLIRLSFKEDVVFPEFISLLIGSSNYVEEQFKISSKGSIMSGLNSTIIKSLNIILPPITEQQKILAFLNKKLNELDNLKSSVVIQIEKLKEYRQSLIYEAVTGKIDVRNYKGKEV